VYTHCTPQANPEGRPAVAAEGRSARSSGAMRYQRSTRRYRVGVSARARVGVRVRVGVHGHTGGASGGGSIHAAVHTPIRPMYLSSILGSTDRRALTRARFSLPPLISSLAFAKHSFTLSRLCTNQSSFHSSHPPALPTLLQY